MLITLPNIPELTTLARLFESAGQRLFCVGSLVRNTLLGLEPSDYDICSAMHPQSVMARLEGAEGIKVYPKAVEFGTVEIHFQSGGNKTVFEHTTFRSDSYRPDGSHRPAGVKFTESLEEDAFRRDFSVNAIYADILTGELFDPTHGLSDIQKKIIRTTTSDPYEILRDDALRLLRLVRFACELGFGIDRASFDAARDMPRLLDDISRERCRDEFSKILLSDARYSLGRPDGEKAHLRGLGLLDEMGALTSLIPELEAGRNFDQKTHYHAYDVLHHLIMTCAHTPPMLTLRLAGLLHDVCKPMVREATGKMYDHEKYGAKAAREILTRLRYPNAVISEVEKLVAWHMYDLSGEAKENKLRKRFCVWGVDFVSKLAQLRIADVYGSGEYRGEVKSAERWRETLAKMLREGAPFSEEQLQASGSDIMEWTGLPPSGRVGEIKRRLLEHCAMFPADNDKERLKRLAQSLQKK